MKRISNYYPAPHRKLRHKKSSKRLQNTGILITIIIVAGMILGILLGRIFTHVDTQTSASQTPIQSCVSSTESDNFVILQVIALSQYPELPTGCEATAATMALNHIGCPTYLESFASLLPCKDLEFLGNGIYGADPNEFFIGNPAKEANSFGCFEKVIINTINQNYRYCHAEKAYGSLEDLCSYIQQDVPVLVWTTMEMQEVLYRTSWILPNGTKYSWPGHEHCMLLVGYDNDKFYFNDPRSGSCVGYERALSELRYEEMGCRAVVILPN